MGLLESLFKVFDNAAFLWIASFIGGRLLWRHRVHLAFSKRHLRFCFSVTNAQYVSANIICWLSGRGVRPLGQLMHLLRIINKVTSYNENNRKIYMTDYENLIDLSSQTLVRNIPTICILKSNIKLSHQGYNGYLVQFLRTNDSIYLIINLTIVLYLFYKTNINMLATNAENNKN